MSLPLTELLHGHSSHIQQLYIPFRWIPLAVPTLVGDPGRPKAHRGGLGGIYECPAHQASMKMGEGQGHQRLTQAS